MSSSQNIANRDHSTDIAPTPQNTPLDTAVLANRPANMGKPKVAAVEEGDDEDDEDDEDVGAMNPASLLAQNPALLALAQHKLGDLVGRDSGYISSLPAPVRRRIDALKGVQVEHSKIESEFQMAILDLEKKFLEKYKPFYERRAAIIAGSAEPTEEEVETGKNADSDDEDDEDEDDEEEGAKIEEVKEEGDSSSDVKGIPEFWLTALRNHRNVSDYITDEDEEALKHLQDITLSYLSDKPGFSLHFTFAPNAFFENKELTKTYYYRDTVGYGGDLVYDLAKGTEIKWKENKDLTKKVEIKKQRNKSTGRTRVIRKVVPTDSFFNFFSPPTPPSPEAVEAGDVDEEEIEELDAKLEVDYLLGEDFKEKIIPRAVDYFTGRALRYEEDSEEEFDEDDFEDEDVSDEDDDEEDERRGGAGAAAGGAGEQGECKQQ